jgi:uncharacterized protein (UPF0371 family)
MPDNHDARSLTPVREAFDQMFLDQGFKVTVYGSSIRYDKRLTRVAHEVSLRLIKSSMYQVEISQIKDTYSGRKVASKLTTGGLATCLKFVQQEFPSDANKTVSHTSAS